MKFTKSGGSISLKIIQEKGAVRISVTDTGCGMLPDEVDNAFERYWQSRDSAYKGSGLGLYIVKGIVEGHGGRVGAETKLGEGSTFYFTLPLHRN